MPTVVVTVAIVSTAPEYTEQLRIAAALAKLLRDNGCEGIISLPTPDASIEPLPSGRLSLGAKTRVEIKVL